MAPRITQPVYDGNTFKVSVLTIARKTYALEFKDSLAEFQWTALSPVVGNGNSITFTNLDITVPQRFYRVRVSE
jgi:hypothetical protein